MMMKARVLGWAFVLLALPGLLAAQERKELRLDVAGEIGIDPQGAVFDYRIDTILPPEMKILVDKAVRQWKFEPVLRQGQPAHAKSGIRLVLAAIPVEKGYQLRMEDVRFLGSRKSLKMVPPRYPRDAQMAGLGAEVLVAVRVGADGKVLDVAPARSRLANPGKSEKTNAKRLQQFEQATVEAARNWQFQPADTDAGDASEITLIVPTQYMLEGMSFATGGWREGPSATKPIPWLAPDRQQYDATGLVQGQSLVVDNPVRLKTRVVGTML